MKVGTDAVVFGAWVGYTGFKRILDIGTGTGVLALIAAQRAPLAMIHAVEIDDDAAAQALENVAASPWPDRVRVHRLDVRRMHSDEHFDLVVCNPPYYPGQSVSAEARDRVAKHSAELSFVELVSTVARLLRPTGRFSVIIPANRETEFVQCAATAGFHLSRRSPLRYVAHRPAKRVMLDMARYQGPVLEWEIVVEGEGPKLFSAEARKLVADLIDR